MKIIIKVLKGNEITLEVDEENTIGNLKSMIEQKTNIPVSHQKLLNIGKTLIDEKQIKFYQLKNESKLTLVVKKSDGLKDAILKKFKASFSDADSILLTEEFLADFERKLQNFSLDDLDRLSASLMNKDATVNV